ncbi:hypothetical protein ON010_g9488 [Phytophthora cinnamomi]|nr:hypothetical protein ON010_g9488 [Phytophthora cinnamomi]
MTEESSLVPPNCSSLSGRIVVASFNMSCLAAAKRRASSNAGSEADGPQSNEGGIRFKARAVQDQPGQVQAETARLRGRARRQHQRAQRRDPSHRSAAGRRYEQVTNKPKPLGRGDRVPLNLLAAPLLALDPTCDDEKAPNPRENSVQLHFLRETMAIAAQTSAVGQRRVDLGNDNDQHYDNRKYVVDFVSPPPRHGSSRLAFDSWDAAEPASGGGRVRALRNS